MSIHNSLVASATLLCIVITVNDHGTCEVSSSRSRLVFYSCSGKVRSTEQMTVLEKMLVILMDPIGGACHARGPTGGRPQVGQQTEEQGRMWTGVFIVISVGRNR